MALVHWPIEIKRLILGNSLAGEEKQPKYF